jgi:hypothetical protein
VRLARVRSQASWFDRGCRAVSGERGGAVLLTMMEDPSRGARVGVRLEG